MLSVALQGLRGRKGPFAGAFIALAVAAALVMACGTLLQAGVRSTPPVERYAGAPIVVGGIQKARVNVGSQNEDSVALFERARVPASLVAHIAAVPGVRRAIADISVPAQLRGPVGTIDGPTGHPVALHPWASAALTPYALQSGRPPARPHEVVIDWGLAQRGRLQLGQRVQLASNAPAQSMSVVGIARTSVPVTRQGVIFTSFATAQRLAAVPGRVDAVGIIATPGTDQHTLADRVRKVVDGREHVVTGSERGDVEHLENIEAREAVTAIGATFGGLALLIAMFVVANTIGLSVLLREREVALLRAVAATPKQVRQMIRWETVLVGLVASAAGVLPGALLAGALGHALSDRGIAPEDMHVAVGAVPIVVAIASSVLTALLAVAAAGRRAARVRPTLALRESAGTARLIGPLRALAGIGAIAGAIGLLIAAAASNNPTSASEMAAGTSFALVLATAFLGPLVVRTAAAFARVVFGRSSRGVSAFLAISNMRTAAGRFGSAMTPLVLTVAVSSTLLFSATTRERATVEQENQRVVADLVLQSNGVGIPSSAVDEARHVPGVATALGVGETTLGPGLGSKYTAAQGAIVDPRGIDRVLDLDVRSGSLSDMRDDTVALSKAQAALGDASVGDRARVVLGDGAVRQVRVVAIYDRSLGFGDVVLPTAMTAGHLTSPLLTSVLIRLAPGASAKNVASRLRAIAGHYPDVTVGDRHAHAARVDRNRESDDWLLRILAGIIFVFTAVAIVNTLMMIALHRTRELALLRLVGGTRRQVLAMARWEGGLTVALGLGIGAAIALITLVPTSIILTGSKVPYAPAGLLALVLGSSAAIGLLATQVSTRIALRPRAVRAISGAD